MLYLCSITLFVSSALLFSIQPMVGKMVLPKLGGTPSVWNTCMVFFQFVLLLGYTYAHVITKFLSPRRQILVHIVVALLPLAVLPFNFGSEVDTLSGHNPSFWLLGQLVLVVGLPFFVVSTSAPLLQKWFSYLGHTTSKDPYFMYSFSNVGSLLALLSYPFLLEPIMGLTSQAYLWSACYILFLILVTCCASSIWRVFKIAGLKGMLVEYNIAQRLKPLDDESQPPIEITRRQRIKWLALAFVPSSLMLGVTTYITTVSMPIPLLWVIPLTLYLLSFIIVFAHKPLISFGLMNKIMVYALLIVPLYFFPYTPPWIPIFMHMVIFFIICIVCHGALARGRPHAKYLTEFYLWISIGGVCGGIFNSFVAPQLFDSVAEYPIMLIASCFLRAPETGMRQWIICRRDYLSLAILGVLMVIAIFAQRMLQISSFPFSLFSLFAIPVLICFGLRKRPLPFGIGFAIIFTVCLSTLSPKGDVLYLERNYFGVKCVRVDSQRSLYVFEHGKTHHGYQGRHPEPSREPLAYFHKTGPIGDVFDAFAEDIPNRHIAVIGLGVGTLASYAKPTEHFTFYEIDPAVKELATNNRLFTYLETCRASYNIVLGDARIEIAKAPDRQFDIIVLDAFSSDSIPAHLLTREALELYSRKLKQNGLIVYHISSNFYDFQPMLAKLAQEVNMVCFSRRDLEVSTKEYYMGKLASRYVVMAHADKDIGKLAQDPHWLRVPAMTNIVAWTDDHANTLSVLCW